MHLVFSFFSVRISIQTHFSLKHMLNADNGKKSCYCKRKIDFHLLNEHWGQFSENIPRKTLRISWPMKSFRAASSRFQNHFTALFEIFFMFFAGETGPWTNIYISKSRLINIIFKLNVVCSMQRIEYWMEFKKSIQFAIAALFNCIQWRMTFFPFYRAFYNLHRFGFWVRSICTCVHWRQIHNL